MDNQEFIKACSLVVDFITEYRRILPNLNVFPIHMKPGDLKSLLPSSPPEDTESIEKIIDDLQNIIVPHSLHWSHPFFFAYFPAGDGFPSLLAEMLSTGLGCLGLGWESCPALHELEYLTMDMYGSFLNLPSKFLHDKSDGVGGGFMQNSSSEAVYSVLLAARDRALDQLMKKHTDLTKPQILARLTCYASSSAHSCCEKACLLLMVQLRAIEPDNFEDALTGEKLLKYIRRDRRKGYFPFFIFTCFGTTGTAAIDRIWEVAKIKRKYHKMWLHLDAAYAGPALGLPEFKVMTNAIRYVDSINVNPYKWSLTAPDGACCWVSNFKQLKRYSNFHHRTTATFLVTPGDLNVRDLSFARRFRCLKLYFTLRSYGKKKLLGYLQNHRSLAKYFAHKVEEDRNLILMNRVYFGLVAFRMPHPTDSELDNDMTSYLLCRLNESGKMHLVAAEKQGKKIIRFSVNHEYATKEHIDRAYQMISDVCHRLLEDVEKIKSGTLSERDSSLKFCQFADTAHRSKIKRASTIGSLEEYFVQFSSNDKLDKVGSDEDVLKADTMLDVDLAKLYGG